MKLCGYLWQHLVLLYLVLLLALHQYRTHGGSMQQQRLVLNLIQLTGNLNGQRSQNDGTGAKSIILASVVFLLYCHGNSSFYRAAESSQLYDLQFRFDVFNWNPRSDCGSFRMKKIKNPVAKYCRRFNKSTVQQTKKRKYLDKKWRFKNDEC